MSELTPLQLGLWLQLLEIPGMEEGESSWGDGPALWVNAKQVANFTRDGTIELRLTRPVIRAAKARLSAEPQAILRGSSDWLGLRVDSEADFALVLDLAREIPPLYLPADGTAPKPPPTGAAMERRKRFH
jgi:hypothetical protein